MIRHYTSVQGIIDALTDMLAKGDLQPDDEIYEAKILESDEDGVPEEALYLSISTLHKGHDTGVYFYNQEKETKE